MIKAFAFIIAFTISFNVFAQVELAQIRTDFYAASLDDEKVPALLEELDKIEEPHAIEIAYKAATEALMAKVVWNPFKKIRYVKKAQDTFVQAIETEPNNVECRFLRFAVEHHIPTYLGFSQNLKEDKQKIFEIFPHFDFHSLDPGHVNYIFLFLIESKRCTVEELELITKIATRLTNN